MTSTIEEKLRSLGVLEQWLAVDSEILSEASTIEQLKSQIIRRQFTCNTEQYLRPIFNELYDKNPAILDIFQKELAGYGIPSELVRKFFAEEKGGHASMVFGAKYVEQLPPSEDMKKFFKRAEELILTTLREYLGIA